MPSGEAQVRHASTVALTLGEKNVAAAQQKSKLDAA